MFSEDEFLKYLRKQLKNHLETLNSGNVHKTRETALLITKLQEASMWLGQDMINRGIFKLYTDEEQMEK